MGLIVFDSSQKNKKRDEDEDEKAQREREREQNEFMRRTRPGANQGIRPPIPGISGGLYGNGNGQKVAVARGENVTLGKRVDTETSGKVCKRFATCSGDDDCSIKDDLWCFDNKCVQRPSGFCRDESHCSENQSCVNNQCAKTDLCETHKNCDNGPNGFCVQGTCHYKGFTCVDDSTCDPGRNVWCAAGSCRHIPSCSEPHQCDPKNNLFCVNNSLREFFR